MGSMANHRRTGGEIVHIGDCYLWAEIYYLDSATDYREYLPQNRDKRPCPISLDDWVLLESSGRSNRRGVKSLPGMMVLLFVLLITGLASYCVLEVLRAAAVRVNTLTG